MGKKPERVVLGSGRAYIAEYDGTIPEPAEIEVEENRLGTIQGGATLEYTPEFYTAEDDFKEEVKTIITSEEAVLKLGIFTWCGTTLEKICSTARVTTEGNQRIVRIGGAGNYNGKSYVILFVHKDKQDGDMRVMIVGKNQAALTITFAKDKETVINPEFKAEPHDEEGTLIKIIEEIKSSLSVTSAAGTEAGKTAVTVTPALTGGNSYKYKVAASPTIPSVGDTCSSGYTNWNGTDEIQAASGQTLVIVEVNAENKAVNVGVATVVSNE